MTKTGTINMTSEVVQTSLTKRTGKNGINMVLLRVHATKLTFHTKYLKWVLSLRRSPAVPLMNDMLSPSRGAREHLHI